MKTKPNTSYILFRSPSLPLSKAFSLPTDIDIIFKEGLYISSQEFYEEYQKQASLNLKEKAKLSLTLSKYWIRSSTRCTPYASFAGCKLANVTQNMTKIVLKSSVHHHRKIRVDMNYITLIIRALLSKKEIQNQILYFPNNSLYTAANEYRYVEYEIKNNNRIYQLTAATKTEYLTAVLQITTKGKRLSELVAYLVEKASVPIDEAESYIDSLTQSQLLIADLEANITGSEPLGILIDKLKLVEGVSIITEKLQKVNTLIKNPIEGVEYLQQIEQSLRDLELSIEIPKNKLQVDLFLATTNAHFEQNLIAEIIKQTSDLKYLARKSRNSELENFKKRFYEKYEFADIPLSIVMDADLGVGYAGVSEESAATSPLVEDLFIVNQEGNLDSSFDYINQFTLSKYIDFLKDSKSTIEIKEEELKALAKETENFKFSNSQYLIGCLLKEEDKLDVEHFKFHLKAFGGPSAGNLLGRFTQGCEQLCTYTKQLLEEEENENPDAIYAEIVHLPQSRIGNILQRPILRKFEIPYIGKSGIDLEHQISIVDLWVRIVDNEIILWSKKHNKRVIPRLTTAHNFNHKSLPVYKFLCDLQLQNIAYPNVWDWGHLENLKHTPRVVYKNIILKKASWRISEVDIQDLPNDKAEYKDYFNKWLQKQKIPKRIQYVEGDNELLIDFDEEVGVELFIHYLRKKKNITCEEFLFTDENCIVRDEKNRPYTNEIIIPISAETSAENSNKFFTISEKKMQQKFTPFSEWIYFKLYCGNKAAEHILRSDILKFVENGITNMLFEQFFFIRYKDDYSHIRIRFYNKNIAKQKELFVLFTDALKTSLDNGLVKKITLDTYTRELERYGNEYIIAAEQIFHADSIAVLRFLALLEGTNEQKYRFIFALRGIDMLLEDFGLTLDEKKSHLQEIQIQFFNEFGGSLQLRKQLNEKYRSYQMDIFIHLDSSKDKENEIDEAISVFKIRSEEIAKVIKQNFSNLKGTEKKAKFKKWLPSYIHMFMNRLYIGHQRKYELVAYHFLEKYYTSQTAMLKMKDKNLEI